MSHRNPFCSLFLITAEALLLNSWLGGTAEELLCKNMAPVHSVFCFFTIVKSNVKYLFLPVDGTNESNHQVRWQVTNMKENPDFARKDEVGNIIRGRSCLFSIFLLWQVGGRLRSSEYIGFLAAASCWYTNCHPRRISSLSPCCLEGAARLAFWGVNYQAWKDK